MNSLIGRFNAMVIFRKSVVRSPNLFELRIVNYGRWESNLSVNDPCSLGRYLSGSDPGEKPHRIFEDPQRSSKT